MSIALSNQSRPSGQSKGQLSGLRRQGWIPAVLYGSQKESVCFSVEAKSFLREMEKPGIRTRVFDLGSLGIALVKEIQFKPTRDVPVHVDFLRLSDRVVVSVPLRFVHGERCPGIKRGGVLNVIHYTLDLSVPSHQIPHELEVNLSGMDIGQTVHLKDVPLPEGSRVLHVQIDESIVSIVAPSGLMESLKEEA